MAGRRLHACAAWVALAAPAHEDRTRIGITVSRKLGGAVQRNRARRRLREIVRRVLLADDSPLASLGIRYDVVLVARAGALELEFASLTELAHDLLRRLTKP